MRTWARGNEEENRPTAQGDGAALASLFAANGGKRPQFHFLDPIQAAPVRDPHQPQSDR